MDTFKITITESGIFKIDTDAVSQANHTNAEGLLRKMTELAGGKVARTAKAGHHHHGHTHTHTHSDGTTHTH